LQMQDTVYVTFNFTEKYCEEILICKILFPNPCALLMEAIRPSKQPGFLPVVRC